MIEMQKGENAILKIVLTSVRQNIRHLLFAHFHFTFIRWFSLCAVMSGKYVLEIQTWVVWELLSYGSDRLSAFKSRSERSEADSSAFYDTLYDSKNSQLRLDWIKPGKYGLVQSVTAHLISKWWETSWQESRSGRMFCPPWLLWCLINPVPLLTLHCRTFLWAFLPHDAWHALIISKEN